MAVPALPRKSSAPLLGNRPPQPLITISFSFQSVVISSPSCDRATAMCLVSSLSFKKILL